MPKTITLKTLRQHGACKSACQTFERLFGTETVVTEELCVKYAQDFDWTWAGRLLPEHKRVAYEQTTEAARVAYEQTTEAARVACRQATDAAYVAYEQTTKAARVAYFETLAREWARLYNED